jgi:DNA adenine methylase
MVRPPLKTHGGKAYLADTLSYLAPPKFKTYIEPFLGGGAMFLAISSNRYERAILNDLDQGTINLWTTLQSQLNELKRAITSLKYDEQTFKSFIGSTTAIGCYVQRNMSRGGLGKTFAWSTRLRGGQPGDLNAWITKIKYLDLVHEKLNAKPTSLFCQDWRLIYPTDHQNTFCYLDPPYLPSTRTSPNAYRHEMSYQEHEALLQTISGSSTPTMLSGYMNPLYQRYLASWKSVVISMPNHSGQGETKQRREEVVWMNY